MDNISETLYEFIWCTRYKNVGRCYIACNDYNFENNSKKLNRLYLKNKINYTISDIEYIIENSEIGLLEKIKKKNKSLLNKINMDNICSKKKIEIIKWVVKNDFKVVYMYNFINNICKYELIEIIDWLYETNNKLLLNSYDYIYWSSMYGNVKVLDWFWNKRNIIKFYIEQ